MTTPTPMQPVNGNEHNALSRANIFAGRCRMRRLTTPEQLAALQAAAAADQHTVLAPTHIAVRGQEVVGYGSLGVLPMLHVWLDSQKVHASDSLRMLETAEAVMENTGARVILMPCTEESPFKPHMERLGYQRLWPTVLWIKQLT